MPQLNPNPWFFIMLLSWLTFSLLIQPKLLKFHSSGSPTDKTTPIFKISPWYWPWT